MELEIEKDSIDAVKEGSNDSPQVPDESATPSVHSKKHSKPKKRDSVFLYGNEVAEILKSSNTSEQKLTTVCNKYSEMLHANRKLMVAYKTAEIRIVKMQQENEQRQQQRSKEVLARSRLENVCRELQKLNKAQKEEIDLKLRLEEEKRKELSATFQTAFAEMSTLTNQNTEKNAKMTEENWEMSKKIQSVRERIQLSEQQLEKVKQQAQLELQLAEAKMAKVKMEMTAEKETLLKEKQQLLLKLTEYQVRVQEMQATEVGLRSQISMYTEKYDDFQNALTKSNEVFSGFNEEMEKMSKKIVKLEKETSLWKQRWEKSHAALLDMASEKQSRDSEMSKLNHKLSLLQELCKAFQRERAELLSQLRAHTHPNPSKDSPKPSKVDIQQVEELSKDCQELKENFVQLQGSLAAVIFENDSEQSQESQNQCDPNHKTESHEVNSPLCESDQEIAKILSDIKVNDDKFVEEKETNNSIEVDDNQTENTGEPAENSRIVTEDTTNNTTVESLNKCELECRSSVEKNVPLSKLPIETPPSPSNSIDEMGNNNSLATDDAQKVDNSGKEPNAGT